MDQEERYKVFVDEEDAIDVSQALQQRAEEDRCIRNPKS